ncbi:hypothetical protein [Flexivirga sp. B27]
MKDPQNEQPPTPGAGSTAADKISAAFTLLTAAFQDSRTDADSLAKDDLVDQVVVAQQVLNTVWALQSARLAQAGAIEERFAPDSRDPRGHRETQVRHPIGSFHAEFIGSDVGPRLGWTTGQAEARVHEATDAITRTPRLFQRIGSGELEPAKLTTIHRALGRVERGVTDDGTTATLDLAREVETAMLGDPNDADSAAEAAVVEEQGTRLLAGQSTPQVRYRTARIIASIDPAAADEAAKRRRRQRVGVYTHPDGEPGLSQLHAILPSAAAARVMAAVDRHARDLHADTTTDKTLAECRADALADLVLGNASVSTHLVVQVPVRTGASYAAGFATSGSSESAAGGAATQAPDRSPRGSAVFAHPVSGLPTDLPGHDAQGSPFASSSSAFSQETGGGSTWKSQDAVDREFNELLKQWYAPDPDEVDHDEDDLFDDSWELDDRWANARPPDPGESATGAEEGTAKGNVDANAQPCAGSALLDALSQGAGPPDACAREIRLGDARLGDAIVPGIGDIPAHVIEAMSRSFGTTMTRALIDADTGITLESSQIAYRPSPRLRHFIETRDRHCRFPGCTRAARWCDIDHVVPWPLGPTAAANLICLCRHHHRTKQSHGWSVTVTPLGVCTWTSPSGRVYLTTPAE